MVHVSVILPCLNEEVGLKNNIPKIQSVFRAHHLAGEIVVVDNGSTDGSARVAKEYEVSYVYEPKRGYGNAYLAGLRNAQGTHLVLGDPDDSYDFADIPRFLEQLAAHDAVLGSRFAGTIEKGAMPFLHRYVGNPGIRFLLRHLHGVETSEPSTGFIALRKDKIAELALKEPGMEFSSELLVKIKRHNLSMVEIPIQYSPRSGTSKLRTLRDGFRHLTYLLREKVSPSTRAA